MTERCEWRDACFQDLWDMQGKLSQVKAHPRIFQWAAVTLPHWTPFLNNRITANETSGSVGGVSRPLPTSHVVAL